MLIHQAFNSREGYHYNAYLYENACWAPHFHKNMELVYVLEGELEYVINSRPEILRPGDFALVLPDQIHECRPVGFCRCWIGVFSGDFVRAFEKQVRGKVGVSSRFRCDEATLALFRFALITCEDWRQARHQQYSALLVVPQKMPDLLLTKGCLYALCAAYARQTTFLTLPGKREGMMQAVTAYIAQHHRNQITLSDVAQALGYNYHYLSKCFARHLGMSFTQYLTACRLETAQQLLLETDMDIARVALESGFQSLRSFNDHFKDGLGMTPSQYRRGEKKGKKER